LLTVLSDGCKQSQSYRWLRFGDIKGKAESTVVAAEDQAINKNYFKRNILKEIEQMPTV
jgi:hypothetical protein